jgi:hypothetical protein
MRNKSHCDKQELSEITVLWPEAKSSSTRLGREGTDLLSPSYRISPSAILITNMFVAQDKAGSTRFGPLEYTILLLRPSGLRPSHLLERLAPLRTAATLIAVSRLCELQELCKLLQ